MEEKQESGLLEQVDARTKLAGSNKMEILLFSLGTKEIYGINVFKVKEVGQTPNVTKTPNMPKGVEGLISLRGKVIPVLSLASFVNPNEQKIQMTKTIIAEYSKHVLGFLVHDVDRIIRVDWEKVKSPESVLYSNQNLITAIVELENGTLVSILDVEQILSSAFGESIVGEISPVKKKDSVIFFCDDSSIARKKITEVLDKLGIKHTYGINGLEGWNKLLTLADKCDQKGVAVKDEINFILIDAEMPEMDGYVLTKNIKSDKRFEGVPVVMHSSLSSQANHAMGKSVGVDLYVAKFDAEVLSETLRPLIDKQ